MHEVLYVTTREDTERDFVDVYEVLSCGGCDTISMMRMRHRPSNDLADDDHVTRGVQVSFYPSPVSRKEPEWASWLEMIGDKNELELVRLLKEIYQAVDGGQHRLAAMGIRALLEQVMISKVGDIRGFDKKLDAFQKAGFISLIQRDAMRATLDVSDAAMHRAFKPNERELNTSLDITEGVMSAIYSHREAAEKLGDRIPPRNSPPPAPGVK